MSFYFSYRVEPDDVQYSRAFDDYNLSVKTLRPVFERIRSEFVESQRLTFINEGAFEGKEHWQELSPMYRRWKQRRFGYKPILQATERMKKSLLQRSHPDQVVQMTDDSFTIGTRVPYAYKHQLGIGVPVRKVIELTELQKTRWNRIVHNYLYEMAYDTFGPTLGRKPWPQSEQGEG